TRRSSDLVHIHPGDGGQAAGGLFVQRGAGGAAEHQSIVQDGRQHQPGDLGTDLHPLLVVHLGDDGGGAAHRLVAEIDRAAGLQDADAVVVDDLQNLGLIKALHRLGSLVVVHQDDPPLAQVDDVAAADHAAVLAVLVQD